MVVLYSHCIHLFLCIVYHYWNCLALVSIDLMRARKRKVVFVVCWLIVCTLQAYGAFLCYCLFGLGNYVIVWILLYGSWHVGYWLVPEVVGMFPRSFIIIMLYYCYTILWLFILRVRCTDYTRTISLLDIVIHVLFRLLG